MGLARPLRYRESAELHPHEAVEPQRVAELAEEIARAGRVHPVVIDATTGVILDGHHRYHALRLLSATRVPTVAVDYHDPAVRLERWSEGSAITKDEVLERALKGDVFPVKTTRHPTLYELSAEPVPLEDCFE